MSLPRPLPFLLLAILLAGCGGGARHGSNERAGLVKGDYTGSYILASNATGAAGGAIVLDVDADGGADGSLTVDGTVYDFTGRIGNDGRLSARGEGIVVQATLDHTDVGTTRTLAGVMTLSGSASVLDARTTLTRVVATR